MILLEGISLSDDSYFFFFNVKFSFIAFLLLFLAVATRRVASLRAIEKVFMTQFSIVLPFALLLLLLLLLILLRLLLVCAWHTFDFRFGIRFSVVGLLWGCQHIASASAWRVRNFKDCAPQCLPNSSLARLRAAVNPWLLYGALFLACRSGVKTGASSVGVAQGGEPTAQGYGICCWGQCKEVACKEMPCPWQVAHGPWRAGKDWGIGRTGARRVRHWNWNEMTFCNFALQQWKRKRTQEKIMCCILTCAALTLRALQAREQGAQTWPGVQHTNSVCPCVLLLSTFWAQF